MTSSTGSLMHWVDDYVPCFCGKVHGKRPYFTLNQQTGEAQMYSANNPYQGLSGQQRANAPMPATMPSRTVGERIDEKINEAMGTVEHYQRLKQRMAGCLEVKVEDIIELGYRL